MLNLKWAASTWQFRNALQGKSPLQSSGTLGKFIAPVSVADPSPTLDVVEANRKFMELSEELYDALIECHWQQSDISTEQDHATSSLPEPIYCWNGTHFLLSMDYFCMDINEISHGNGSYSSIQSHWNVLWIQTILNLKQNIFLIYLWLYKTHW